MIAVERIGGGRRDALRRRREFTRVQARGRRVTAPSITVFAHPAPAVDAPGRLGLVVGKAVGSAVVRNRIRRRLRAAWRSARRPPGIDMVVRADRGAASLPFQELVNLIERAAAEADR